MGNRLWAPMFAMAVMAFPVALILAFVRASTIADASTQLESVERWARVLEGFRRFGVGLYLLGIALGLGTIIHLLRFQSIRIRQLPDNA